MKTTNTATLSTLRDDYRAARAELAYTNSLADLASEVCSEGTQDLDAVDLAMPYCACGRVVSRCDGSRRGCTKPR
jgi:hypothetical protein